MWRQDCQYWLAYLGMQCRLHELRHKRRISVAAASKILANLVYSYKGMGLSMGTMCAGVTPEEGPALYYIDSDGTRLAGDRFCVGSGQTFAYGVLDAEYSYDLSDEDARELGKRSILAATHRDAFSGGFINLYHVKEQGWEVSCVLALISETLMLTPAETRIHGHQPHILGDEAHQGRVLERYGEAGVGWVGRGVRAEGACILQRLGWRWTCSDTECVPLDLCIAWKSTLLRIQPIRRSSE